MQHRKRPIFDEGIVIFRETVAQHEDVRARVQELLLSALRIHRGGGAMNSSLLRGVLGMLIDLGVGASPVYQDEFESPMLVAAESFYHSESREVLSSVTAAEYCRYAERRLAEERSRADDIMHPSTVPKLLRLVEDSLVAEHVCALVEMEGSGLVAMIAGNRLDDIARLHRLCAPVKTAVAWRLPPELCTADRERERAAAPAAILKDVLKSEIIRAGVAALFDPDAESSRDPCKLVQSLLDLRDKYVAIVDGGFSGDRIFSVAMKEVREAARAARTPAVMRVTHIVHAHHTARVPATASLPAVAPTRICRLLSTR